MTTADALIRAVLAAPEDDTPRLVFADWLDDHDQPERAEFIRLQVKVVRLPKWVGECKVCQATPDEDGSINHGKGCYTQSEDGGGSEAADTNPERDELERRADALSATHGDSWIPAGLVGRAMWRWERGFVNSVRTLDGSDWLLHAAELLTMHPVRAVELASWPDNTGPDFVVDPWRYTATCDEWPGVDFNFEYMRDPVDRYVRNEIRNTFVPDVADAILGESRD